MIIFLQDKDRRLKRLKDEIKREGELEEKKIRAEKKDMIKWVRLFNNLSYFLSSQLVYN